MKQPQAKTVPVRAAIYTRLSVDPDGTKASPERQESAGRKLAAAESWKVVDVYCDRNRSASKEEVHREQFERLREDMKAGKLDKVIVWKFDRLARSVFVSEQFHRDAQELGVEVVSFMEPGATNLTRRVTQAVDQDETERISMRVKDAHEHLARAGKPNGGHRPFGFEQGRTRLRENEAALLRDAARRILAGESVRAIHREWRAKGIRGPEYIKRDGTKCTATGKPISRERLVAILKTPSIAGIRTHRGEVIGDAAWPAIIDRATWERLQQVLRSPERRKADSTARKYLLGGLLHCAECGYKIVSRPACDRQGNPIPGYKCTKDTGGCGGIRQNGAQLDEFIATVVIQTLTQGKLLGRMAKRVAGQDQRSVDLLRSIQADETKLDEIASMYAAGEIDRHTFLSLRVTVAARLKANQRGAAQSSGTSFLASVPRDAAGLRGRWENADLTWRRKLVVSTVEKIELGRKTFRGNAFDPNRVRVTWIG